MSYSTQDKIKSLLKGEEIDEVSIVTNDDLDNWRDEYSAYIDCFIAAKNTTPPTTTAGLKMCDLICSKLVAAHALEVIYGTGGRDAPDIVETWRTQANDLLEKIAEGKISITAEMTDNFKQTGLNDSNGNEREPVFTKGKVF